MTEAEVYAALGVIFQDVFVRDDIVLTPALSANDVKGWDSFKQIEIVMAVEERYGVRFGTRELDNLRSVGDLVSLVLAKAG